jgi:hypothetical protein
MFTVLVLFPHLMKRANLRDHVGQILVVLR